MARARVEALGLLGCYVGELRHNIPSAVVSGAVAVSRAGLWLLPTCRRWTGCPSVLDRVREPVLRRRPVELYTTILRTLNALPSRRQPSFARWAAKRVPSARVPSVNDTGAAHRSLHGSAGTGRSAGPASVRVYRLAKDQGTVFGSPQGNGRATGSTQSLTTPATAVPSFVESGSAEGAAHWCQALGSIRFSHLAAPRDAARLAWVPP